MKILALTRYSRLGASSRLRIYQYVDAIQNNGHLVTVSPLFSDQYVLNAQNNYRNYFTVFSSLIVRMIKLIFQKNRFDLLLIEKEAMPYFPAFIELFLLSKNIPYILDYDDAVFHNYDLSKNSIVRFFLKNKHKAIIEKSKLVIVGNQYLYKYAISASARRVEVVPTVVDLMRYSCSTSNRIRKDQSRKMPIVGWIGQKSTLTQLLSIKEILKDVVLNNKAVFNMIGGGSYNFDFQVNSIVWSEETEVSEINKFDIGIMPLYDSPFERGKCGYKLIQYMACGIPVVASPVGVNKEIVIHGVNGFLAETEEEWMASLNKLLTDPDLRKKMGKSAFESVSTKYSLQAYQSRFVKLLESVV